MIPSSPLKQSFFQITNLKIKNDNIDIKTPSKLQFITQHSPKQFIVFIFFFIVVMISCFLQSHILNSYRSNEYVKKFYGSYSLNQYDILKELENVLKI